MNSSDDSPVNGPAWAAVLAAAVGCACFGILVDLTEAFHGFSRALNFYNPTGDLSGKSALAVAAWLVAWALLRFRWKGRDVNHPARVAVVSVVLILFALVATFPPCFELFSAG